jgi:hypothetical protein
MLFTNFPNTMTPEEINLIDYAYANWNNVRFFSDKQVAQVKQLLARIFNEPSVAELKGGPRNGAFVLEDKSGPKEVFYCLMKKGGSWECMIAAAQLEGVSAVFPGGSTPFSTVLTLMHMSEMRRLESSEDEEEEQDEDEE